MNSLPEKTTSRASRTRTGIAFGLRQAGFTLVEIAVALAIIGLALGTGITVLNARLTQAKIDTTKARVEGVRQALVAYVSQNYRLPCPAGPGLKQGDTGFNAEEGTVAGCITNNGVTHVGLPLPAGLSRGTVPCATLGIAEEACYDAYGTRLTYFVEEAAARLAVNTISGIKGSMTIHKIVPPAAPTPSTANQINNCNATPGDNSCNSLAVAMIISHGANRGGGYPPGGIVQHPTTVPEISIYEQLNADNNITFLQNDYVEKGVNSFDDMVSALVPRDLIKTLAQTNVIKDPKVLMAEQFETIKLAILQQAFVTKVGTNITLATESSTAINQIFPMLPDDYFKDCTVKLGSTQALPTPAAVGALTGLVNDIWSNPIRYRVAQTGSFGSSTLCSIPFVLVSYGPDGQTGGTDNIFGKDDIIFPVTMGAINSVIIKLGGW